MAPGGNRGSGSSHSNAGEMSMCFVFIDRKIRNLVSFAKALLGLIEHKL